MSPDDSLRFSECKKCHKYLNGAIFSSHILFQEALVTWKVIKCDNCIYKVILTYEGKTAEYQVMFKGNRINFILLTVLDLPSIRLTFGKFSTKNAFTVKYITEQGLKGKTLFSKS